MSMSIVIERTIPFSRRGRAANQAPHADERQPPTTVAPPRVPRIARLMALALHIEALLQTGTVSSYAEVARLGHVSRARVSQILSLVQLAPDLQEQLLFLKRLADSREPLPIRHVLSVAAILDWSQQRRRWRKLRPTTHARSHTAR